MTELFDSINQRVINCGLTESRAEVAKNEESIYSFCICGVKIAGPPTNQVINHS